MTTKNMIRIITISMGLLAAVPVMGFAQTSTAPSRPATLDARWTPYLGCWRLYQENLLASDVPVSDVMMVCVTPSQTGGGVTMTTYAAGRPVLTQTILADGQAQPVNEANCLGTQTNEWSRDGERLFSRADVSCNSRPRRMVSGVTLMTKGSRWIDVQATEVDGNSQVRIRRYQRTSERPADVAELAPDVAARVMADSEMLGASAMTLEDVIEANKKVSSAALEAAIDETGARFNLNSRALKQLADAGVSPNVIDLMVAQSFPSQFRVERAASAAPPVPSSMSMGGTTNIYGDSVYGGGIYGGGMPAAYGYPYYDPYYSYYSYYSPFAYPYWGSNSYYNNYDYRGGVPTVIVPGGGGGFGIGGGGTAITTTQDSPGMVVNGRGYTRVTGGSQTPAASGQESSPAQHTPGSTRGVRSSGDSTSSPASVSSSGYSSGSSSTPSSSAPSGGGGGDSGGGRTAEPR